MTEPKNSAPKFQAVRRFGPTQQVREQLLAAIQKGDLPPGSALPPERELSETFGVSRVSVRQALAALEAMDLVTIQHGRGAFVRDTPDDQYGSRVKTFISVHRDSLIELTDVRGALDELAAAKVAAAGDREAIDRIRAASEAFADAIERDDLASAPDLDRRFHLAIADHSDSTLLTRLLHDLNDVLTESRGATFSYRGQAECSVVEHRAIVDAIAAGDPDAARHAARAHMERISAWLRSTDDRVPSTDDAER
ncbi:GntR family transcriptional regulator [Gordonia spumicola]|uniref:GntR family transcriptional regulator n=1 Tax=Gordonia spumicola TaxID=589161 RepID=A0A7I9V340_9ACTN|nr:FadR/GntR family transcriptional regulator [Gordonia spumicola]GED99828.1 GntR family transcriptional regulator [Gordonia spumicola]